MFLHICNIIFLVEVIFYGKTRKRKKWIAKPTEFQRLLRLARTKHRGFYTKSVSEATGILRPRLQEYETEAREYQAIRQMHLTRYYLDIKYNTFQTTEILNAKLARGCKRHVTNFPYMKEH